MKAQRSRDRHADALGQRILPVLGEDVGADVRRRRHLITLRETILREDDRLEVDVDRREEHPRAVEPIGDAKETLGERLTSPADCT